MVEAEGSALADRLEALMRRATALPWAAFDRSDILAVMKGKCPPLGADGYPSRKWPEIISWTGFDSSDVPMRYRRANLHLIVELVNALPAVIAALRTQAATQKEAE